MEVILLSAERATKMINYIAVRYSDIICHIERRSTADH
jgi:hypothetical protein